MAEQKQTEKRIMKGPLDKMDIKKPKTAEELDILRRYFDSRNAPHCYGPNLVAKFTGPVPAMQPIKTKAARQLDLQSQRKSTF